MNQGKPTVDDILALYHKLHIYYGTLHAAIERDEAFYELAFKNELKLPAGFEDSGVVLPTARDFGDTFVDHIDISNARVFANKRGIYKKSNAEMEMLRKFGQGILNMTNLATDISQWRVSGKHYANHGLTAIGTFWDVDMWPDKPIRKDDESEEAYAERIETYRADAHLAELPIILKAIHPHNLLMDPSNPRQFVIEESTMMRLDAEKLYPWWNAPSDKSITDEVVKIDYWDKDFHCTLVDREPVLRVPDGVDHHRHGFLPYVVIESGLGNMSYKNLPEMRYVGILRYIYDLLISESRNYSISDVVLAKTAWGGGFLENTSGNEIVVKSVEQNFGVWQTLPAGIKAVPVTPQTPPQALNDHLSRTSYYLQAHAAPSSLRGMGEEGVRSGADRRLVMAQAMAKYLYANEAYASGAARVLVNCAKLAKNVIPGDVTVWFRTPRDEFDVYTIEKDKLKEPFNFTVEFAPVSDDDEYKRHQDLEQLVAAGIVPPKWARQQMSNVDAEQIELDIEKEKIKNDPALQQIASQYAQAVFAKAIQGRIDAEAVKEGGMPQGMPPGMPVPGMPPQGMQPQGQPPAPPLETGGRMIPPIREVVQPGTLQDLSGQMAAIAPPRPKLAPLQGFGGGGNTP